MKGLVLSGGGARGAYQAGVLKAVAEVSKELGVIAPFPIMTGVSAGAINAAFLASQAEDFLSATKNLYSLWEHLTSSQVFKTDALSIGKIGLRWMGELSLGGLTITNHNRALLDTGPLKQLIEKQINFSALQSHIKNKYLHALGVTALDYGSSESISFVQGIKSVNMWIRPKRHSEQISISADHIMASSAIPLIFPSVNIENRHFGDGCLRNLAPCSPAIKLGAKKILVIGVQNLSDAATPESLLNKASAHDPPSVAKVISSLIQNVLLDGVELDMDRLNRINQFIAHISEDSLEQIQLKPIEALWIYPSEEIGHLASAAATDLPRVIRYFLKGLGPIGDASELLSYLLFEPVYLNTLLELGYRDGLDQRDKIFQFLT